MEGKMVKQISLVSIIALMLFFIGCFPMFPVSRQSKIDKKDLKSIVVGTTTKAEIYDLLGKPNCLENDRYFVYEVNDWRGGLSLWYEGIDFGGKSYHILLEFDEKGTLTNYEVEKGVIEAGRGERHGVPDETTVSELSQAYEFNTKFFLTPPGTSKAVISPLDSIRCLVEGGC